MLVDCRAPVHITMRVPRCLGPAVTGRTEPHGLPAVELTADSTDRRCASVRRCTVAPSARVVTETHKTAVRTSRY